MLVQVGLPVEAALEVGCDGEDCDETIPRMKEETGETLETDLPVMPT